MNPTLKAYLDKLHADTMAQYDEIHKQLQLQDALLSKFAMRACTPQMARSTVAASGGGLSIDTPIVTVVPDVSSFDAKAQEILEVAPDASPTSIETAPVTCSTDCSTQVFTVVSVNEVHGAATTVYPEPAVNLNHKEVAQLTPVQATPPIGISTSSLAEVVPPVATITDTVPSVAMAAKPAPTRCLAEFSAHTSDWVKPLIATTERLHPSSFAHQPWPPPVQVQFSHMGHLFRPRPWPSFKPLSEANYPKEPCTGIHFHPHEALWFSFGLVLRLFRDVVFPPVSCCEMISMEEYFSCLSVAQLQSRRPPDQAPPDTKALNELAFLKVGISTSITVDAWFSLRFLRTICRPIDTAPHVGRWINLDFSNMGCQGQQSYACSILQLIAGAEYFVHWNLWVWSTTCVMVEMDPMASTEAWKHLCCQHLISLWAYQLLLDHMFEQSNSHDWESLPYSNQRTSPAYFGMVDSNSARMCEWNLQCSLSKWLEEVGSGQNSEDCVPLGCYVWGLLNPHCYQTSMSSCFHGYSLLYGLVLLQWEIAWTLHLEFSSSGNNSGQPFLPPSMTCAESTGKQEVTQGGRDDGAHVGYVCCIYHTYYCDQVPGGHNNYPDTSRRQASVGHDYYFYGVEVYINYGYHRDYDQAKQHRVQWDPGGSRRRRLGVKPNLKERGMLGALLAYTGLPRPAHGPGPLENLPDYKYRGGNRRKGIRRGSGHGTGGGFSSHLGSISHSPSCCVSCI